MLKLSTKMAISTNPRLSSSSDLSASVRLISRNGFESVPTKSPYMVGTLSDFKIAKLNVCELLEKLANFEINFFFESDLWVILTELAARQRWSQIGVGRAPPNSLLHSQVHVPHTFLLEPILVISERESSFLTGLCQYMSIRLILINNLNL